MQAESMQDMMAVMINLDVLAVTSQHGSSDERLAYLRYILKYILRATETACACAYVDLSERQQPASKCAGRQEISTSAHC